MENRLAEFVNDHYLLRVHRARCTQCGNIETKSEVFLVKIHPSLTTTTTARMLKPIETLGEPLPIAKTILPTKLIPLCHLCVDSMVATPLKTTDERAWAEAIRNEAQREAEARQKAQARSHVTHTKHDPNALAGFLDSIGDV